MRLLSILAVSLCVVGAATTVDAQMPKPPRGPVMQMEGSNNPKVLPALKKAFDSAKATMAKKPKDKKARETFIDAGVKYGHESMVSPLLTPHVKYAQALRIYREVLKVDPNNPVAKPESDLIISIYKSMHRPIPK